MLSHTVYHKQLPFQAVLMDTWYATKDMMMFIESLQEIYYYPLKDNRQVDDSRGQSAYQRIDALEWIQRNHIGCAFLVWVRSRLWRPKRDRRFISSSMVCSMIIFVLNLGIHLSR
jgi:hypothetical protein